MTISTAGSSISYAGNGLTLVFGMSFPYQLSTDLLVRTRVDATGVYTTLVLGTDYIVNPSSNTPANNGSVITTVAPPSGTTIVIERVVPLTQLTTWQANDAYPANFYRIENALDKLTMALMDFEDSPINPGGDTSTFVRGDGSLSNALVGTLGAVSVPTDAQTVMQAGQNGDAAYKVSAGATSKSSYRFAKSGSANPWEMQWVYDPNIAAIGWQPYGGAIKGTFGDNGNVAFGGALDVTGNLSFGGAITGGTADASLITGGVFNVARVGTGSGAANTFLNGVGAFSIPAGGGGINTTTTGSFVIAAISSTQTVPVASTTGIVVGTQIQVGDGTHIINGHVTAIASLNLTVKTDSIAAGSAGNTMASGAAVQGSIFPGNNTVLLGDAETAPRAVGTILGTGGISGLNLPNQVFLYLEQTVGPSTVLQGVALHISSATLTWNDNSVVTATAPSLYGFNTGDANARLYSSSTSGDVFRLSSTSALGFGKLTASSSITAATITPALLNCTNALTDTYLFGYDSGTGHFKMFANGGVPAGGNTGQFLRGDNTWSNFLSHVSGSNLSIGDTGFNYLTVFGGSGTGSSMTQSSTASGGTNDYTAPMFVLFPFIVAQSVTNTIDALPAFTTFPTEAAVFQNWIRTSVGVRTAAGSWANTSTHNAPTSTLTIDVNSSAYHRITGMTGNVTVTIDDTTPVPSNSSFRYAGEMVVEVVAPGANLITWAAASGSITWVGGGSAPTLSTSGTTIVRFVRRQGVSGWLGSVDVATSGTTYTDGQARGAVLNSTYLIDSSTIAMNVVAGTSATPAVKAASIGNTQLANGIQASKLQGYPGDSTKFLNGAGGWTVPTGGGGGSFNPNVGYTWTARQDFTSAENTFSITQASYGSSTFMTKLNAHYSESLYQDANAIDVTVVDNYATPPGGGGVGVAYYNHTVTARTIGGESIHHHVDVQSTTASGFNISHTIFTQARRMNGGVVDALWFSAFSPDSTYSGSNNPTTGAHDLFTTGIVRVGEMNYGNAWSDFGRQDTLLGSNIVSGPWLVPDWLGEDTTTNHHYDSTFGLVIAAAGADFFGHTPKSWVGLHINQNAIVGVDSTGTHANYGTGGWGVNIHGGSGTTVAAAAGLRISDYMDVGIDLSSATITTEWVSTHTNKAAILLASGHAICFKAPTGANTGVYIWFNGTNLVATKDGGNTTATII